MPALRTCVLVKPIEDTVLLHFKLIDRTLFSVGEVQHL